MDITVFIDETGDLLNPAETAHFGFGFVYLPKKSVPDAENLLLSRGLWKIHVKDLPYLDKKAIARQVANCGLHKLGLHGGAAIEPRGVRAKEFMMSELSKRILDNPELIIKAIPKHKRWRHLKNKAILTPNDLFSKVREDARLTEFALHAIRIPIVKSMHAFGAINHLNFEVFFSASSNAKAFAKRFQTVIGPELSTGFFEFLEALWKKGGHPGSPRDYIKIKCAVVESSEGLIGLADLLGAVGHHLWNQEIEPSRKLGSELYETLSCLFPEPPLHDWECRPGIFFIRRDEIAPK